jgi:hypothetical protein
MIIPFVLSNAPNTFIWFMHQVLRSFMGKFVLVYFNDIIIYNLTVESHLKHLRAVFNILSNEKLYVNQKKCKFFTNTWALLCLLIVFKLIEVRFLQLLSGRLRKTSTMFIVFMVLHFFIKKIIMNFNSLIAPITECLNRCTFQWPDKAETSFQLVK